MFRRCTCIVLSRDSGIRGTRRYLAHLETGLRYRRVRVFERSENPRRGFEAMKRNDEGGLIAAIDGNSETFNSFRIRSFEIEHDRSFSSN